MPSDSSASDDLTREVAQGSGFVFVGNVLGKVLSTVLRILLSRTLGVAAYGLYSLGLSVLKFAREIASLGLQGGIVRFGASEHGRGDVARLKGTFLSSIAMAVASGAILGAIGYFSSGWIARVVFNSEALEPVLRVFSASLPFHVGLYVTSRAARALHEMRYDVAISAVIQPAFNLFFVGIAFLLGFRLGGALYAFLASISLSFFLSLYLIGRIFPAFFSSLSPIYAPRRLLYYSLAVLGASFSNLLLDQTDRIMLGILATETEVGIYDVAALAAFQLRFVLYSVNSSFAPIISDLYHQSRVDRLKHLFKTTTRWILALSLPLYLILVTFPTPIMRIFGSDFTAGAVPLMILATAFFIDGSVGASGYMLQMSDHERIVLANNVVLASLNIVLNIWLISVLGTAGAALATGLSIATVNLVKLVEVRYFLGMHPYQIAQLKPFVAGIAAVGAGWGIHQLLAPWWAGSWIIGILGLCLTYLGILFSLGLKKDDREVLTPLLAKMGLQLPDPSS